MRNRESLRDGVVSGDHDGSVFLPYLDVKRQAESRCERRSSDESHLTGAVAFREEASSQ